MIWHIVITEYVVLASTRFLVAACNGVVGAACLDSWMGGNGCSILVALTNDVRGGSFI